MIVVVAKVARADECDETQCSPLCPQLNESGNCKAFRRGLRFSPTGWYRCSDCMPYEVDEVDYGDARVFGGEHE